MMNEIPMPYIKANQAGIVLFTITALLLHQPWILAALWIIQVIGLWPGKQWNLFVRLAKPFLQTAGRETQAVELQRFNNTLAVSFLTLSLLSFALGWTVAANLFAGLLIAAAGVALLGYCIGCTMYYWYKQILARRKLRRTA